VLLWCCVMLLRLNVRGVGVNRLCRSDE